MKKAVVSQFKAAGKPRELAGYLSEQCLFSQDGKLLFVRSGRKVLVYSVRSGECVCSLIGHSAEVSSLLIHPNNTLNLLTLDISGNLRSWDITRGKCVFSVNLSEQLSSDVAPSSLSSSSSNSSSMMDQWTSLVGGASRSELFDARYDLDEHSSVVEDTASTVSSLSSLLTSTAAGNNSKLGLSSRMSDEHSGSKHMSIVFCLRGSHTVFRIALIGSGAPRTCNVDVLISQVQRRKVRSKPTRILNLALSHDGTLLSLVCQKEIAMIKVSEWIDRPAQAMSVVSWVTGGWNLAGPAAFSPAGDVFAFAEERGSVRIWHDYLSVFDHTTSSFMSAMTGVSDTSVPVWSLAQWLSMDDIRDHPAGSSSSSSSSASSGSATSPSAPSSSSSALSSSSMSKQTAEMSGSKTHGPWNSRIGQDHRYRMQAMHWHAAAVASMKFTRDGAYLMTGGAESVLMTTQLATNRRTPLPRLGGGIVCIDTSPDERMVAVTLDSNVVRFVDSLNNKVSHSIEGIGLCTKKHRSLLERSKSRLKGRPVMDTKRPKIAEYRKDVGSKDGHRRIVLESSDCTLQIYDLIRNVSLGSLDLTSYPRVFSKKTNHYHHNHHHHSHQNPAFERHHVSAVALNGNGTRLATVITSTAESMLSVVRRSVLQIWHMQQGEFILNSRVDSPHGGAVSVGDLIVDGLEFDPCDHYRLISYASKGSNEFKVWGQITKRESGTPQMSSAAVSLHKSLQKKGNNSKSSRLLVSWQMKASGWHRSSDECIPPSATVMSGLKKGCSFVGSKSGAGGARGIESAAFSKDGSVLITVGGMVMSIWDSTNIILLRTIAVGSPVTTSLCTTLISSDNVKVLESKEHSAMTSPIDRVMDIYPVNDSHLIVVCSDQVCLWDAVSLECLSSLAFDDDDSGHITTMLKSVIMPQWLFLVYRRRPEDGPYGDSVLFAQVSFESGRLQLMSEWKSSVNVSRNHVFVPSLLNRGVFVLSQRDGSVFVPLDDSDNSRDEKSIPEHHSEDVTMDDQQMTMDLTRITDIMPDEKSVFDKIFGGAIQMSNKYSISKVSQQTASVSAQSMRDEQQMDEAQGRLAQMLEGSAHTLPPFAPMFVDWMKDLIPGQKQNKKKDGRDGHNHDLDGNEGGIVDVKEIEISEEESQKMERIMVQKLKKDQNNLKCDWNDSFFVDLVGSKDIDNEDDLKSMDFLRTMTLFSSSKPDSLLV